MLRSLPYVAALALFGFVAWGYKHKVHGSVESAASENSASTVASPRALAHVSDPADSADGCSCVHHDHTKTKSGERTAAEAMAQEFRANRPEIEKLLREFRDGEKTIHQSLVGTIRNSPLGKHIKFTAAGIEWSGILDSRTDSSGVFHAGITLDDELGRFQISQREDQKLQAYVFFNGENLALAGNGFPDDGSLAMNVSSVDVIVCAPKGSVYSPAPLVESAAAIAPAGPVAALPNLSSKPNSTFVLYVDLDGEVVTHPGWNGGQTINALPHPRAQEEAFVTKVWARVSEDFAGFDLNVTTDRAVYDAAATSRRVMCVATPTNDAAPGAGGVAYLNSFGSETPCWAFNGSEGALADTISHEVGHTLGLTHDGTTAGVEYYGGHGSGITSWAPIMGAYFADGTDDEFTTWSKGEYPAANNPQDDFTVILGNGFGYAADDKGNTQATAAFLASQNGVIQDSGVIERTSDVDWVSFMTSGGIVTLDIKVTDINSTEHDPRGSNLAISAELYDADGVLILTSNDPGSLDARISTSLEAGTYYVKLDGVGKGTLATGFSDYASTGQYKISGTVPQDGLLAINPSSKDFTYSGGKGTFDVDTDYEWTWSCNEPWVTSVEETSQTGNQLFSYVVQRNNELAPRSAEITVSIGGYSVIHTINQDPSNGDDHSNFPNGATLVTQNSITDGFLEESGDLDVFQIRVTQFGELTLSTTGTTNTFGEFLTYQGTVIASNDNALLPNFQITQQVSPGLYYVRVRHALELGTGRYKLVASFNSDANLSATPADRFVSAAAGNYDFSVVCSAGWTWSSNAAWLTSAETTNQFFGQKFSYSVAANAGAARTGKITITSGAVSVEHTVNQLGALSDDHGNTFATATLIGPNASMNGQLEAVKDDDVFEVVLPTNGDLRVWSTGTTDTFGALYDSGGQLIQYNDDSTGINFSMTAVLSAGTYYVKVRHFSASGIGAYAVHTSVTPSTHVTAAYTAEPGGSLTGRVNQSIVLGGSATVVTAVPSLGYSFMGWSDGYLPAARNDQNLVTHLSVTARFLPTLSVSYAGGSAIRNNQTPKINYNLEGLDPQGIWIGEIVPISFEIWNNGTIPLTGLNVTKTGVNIADWTLSTLATTTLQPGQSTVLTGTFQASTSGSKSAYFVLSVNETGISPFRIPVIATVLNNIVIVDIAEGSPDVSSAATTPEASSATPPIQDMVLLISPDGYFHHFFSLQKGAETIPDFYVSADGDAWQLSDVIAIRQIGETATTDEFEIALSPMGLNTLSLWVTVNPPAPGQP